MGMHIILFHFLTAGSVYNWDNSDNNYGIDEINSVLQVSLTDTPNDTTLFMKPL